MTWNIISNNSYQDLRIEDKPDQSSKLDLGMKFDKGKPMMDLLPPRATLLLIDNTCMEQKRVLDFLYRYWESGDEKFLEKAILNLAKLCDGTFQACEDTLTGVGQVLSFGAKKYERHNWAKGIKTSRNFAAAVRHILQVAKGETIDPESGLHHYYHALCDLFFLYETLSFTDAETWDDRFRWENRCKDVV